jgi:hypothetical protein
LRVQTRSSARPGASPAIRDEQGSAPLSAPGPSFVLAHVFVRHSRSLGLGEKHASASRPAGLSYHPEARVAEHGGGRSLSSSGGRAADERVGDISVMRLLATDSLCGAQAPAMPMGFA